VSLQPPLFLLLLLLLVWCWLQAQLTDNRNCVLCMTW
jgi:hypothetical protein